MRDDKVVWVLVGWPDKKRWWLNFSEPHAAELLIARTAHSATGQALRGTDAPDAVADGLATYLKRIPKAARSVGLEQPTGTIDSGELRRAAADAVMVRFELKT